MQGIELANYIVEKQIKENDPTNTLSLQKVIYFVNAEYMKFINRPSTLIDEPMEKWKFGPVVPEVYHEYSFFGSLPITNIPFTQLFDWDTERFITELNVVNLTIEDLNTWIDKYIDHERFELVEATHRHMSWKRDEELINSGTRGIIYDTNELYEEIMTNQYFFEV